MNADGVIEIRTLGADDAHDDADDAHNDSTHNDSTHNDSTHNDSTHNDSNAITSPHMLENAIDDNELIDYSTKFTIFTDGSALGNSKNAPAGWACYFPQQKVLRSKSMIGTNNQAELEAISYALWWFTIKYASLKIPDNIVYLFSDSEYAIKSINGEYNGKLNTSKIMNIRQLIEGIKRKSLFVRLIHCDAHTGKNDFISVNNAIVDHEARQKAAEAKAK